MSGFKKLKTVWKLGIILCNAFNIFFIPELYLCCKVQELSVCRNLMDLYNLKTVSCDPLEVYRVPPSIYLFNVNDENIIMSETCSKLRMKTSLTRHEITGVDLVSLLLTFNRFDTFCWYFHGSLWTSKCWLRYDKVYSSIYLSNRFLRRSQILPICIVNIEELFSNNFDVSLYVKLRFVYTMVTSPAEWVQRYITPGMLPIRILLGARPSLGSNLVARVNELQMEIRAIKCTE